MLILSGCQSLAGAAGGGGGSVAFSSSNLVFGSVVVGSNKVMQDTLTNNTTNTVTITSIQGSTPIFALSGLSMPLALAAGQTASFDVQFQPSATGNQSNTLTFVADSGANISLALSGDGVTQGQLATNPPSVNFGNIKTGGNQATPVQLMNTGGTDVTISQATLSGAGFSMSSLSLPLTLSAGNSTSITVTFAPPGTGSYSGSITFVTSISGEGNGHQGARRTRGAGGGSGSNLVLALSGNGVTGGTLSPNPSTLGFGNVQVETSKTLSETLTNTGGSSVTISQASASGNGFSISGLTLPVTLSASQSVSFSAIFNPAAAGSASGTLSIVSDASNSPLSIPLSGTGLTQGALTANPASVNFGNVTVGSNKSVQVAVTNSGGESLTISGAAASGGGFSFNGPSLPVTLTAGASANFSAIFTPIVAGASSGNLTITSNGSNGTLIVPLSGTGLALGQLGSNPASFNFGNVQVSTSSSLSGSLTNSGGSSLTITAASITGANFSLSGLTLPVTLNAGQSTSFSVLFSPTATGAASATFNIASTGSNPNLAVPLSGTGVAQGDLVPNPSSISFGNVQDGMTSSQSETLTNNGGTTVTISAAAASGTGFSISGLTLPVTLTSGQSTSFTVKFSPSAVGSVTGNVNITSNGSNPSLNIPLSGTGVTQGSLSPNPSSISFGNVQDGTSSSQSETLTNNGGTSVTISAAAASGTGFSISGLTLPVTLTPGQSTSFTVKFSPTSGGAVSGNVNITSNGSNPSLNIALSGTGITAGTLSPSPSSLGFGSVLVGNSANLSETITNTGGSSVTISQVNGVSAPFSISGLTLPATLATNQSVTFTATFAPTSTGSASGTMAVISTASNSPLNIAFSGTGTGQGQLAVSPTSLSFGTVSVGSSASLGGSLNASGSAVTVSSASSTSSEFTLSGISFPVTIPAGQSATFSVTFTPNASGAASASLTFNSNASNTPATQSLSGTGQAPVQHHADLTWDVESGAVSYNVYRKLPTDPGYTQIDSGQSSASYTDNNVTAGTTYLYVVTGVNAEEQESGYSNVAQVTIPTP